MRADAHYEGETQGAKVPFGRGPALGGVYPLSCYLSLFYSETKWDKKKHSRSFFLGGGGCCAILWIRH